MPLSTDTAQKCSSAKSADNAASSALKADAVNEPDPARKQRMLTAAQQCDEAAAALVQVLVDPVD